MARKPRFSPGGVAYHVMNRTPGRVELFEDAGDYQAFEKVLIEALDLHRGMRLCAYCLMPNHFHLVLWPKTDGQLSRFMQWLSMTHVARWHAHRHSVGRGHLYQGRFRSFPIQQDHHFLGVCRYVERNALRANLVAKAQDWRWSSLWARDDRTIAIAPFLAPWPVERPGRWVANGEPGGIGAGTGRVAACGCPREAVWR
jgi:putative transposase